MFCKNKKSSNDDQLVLDIVFVGSDYTWSSLMSWSGTTSVMSMRDPVSPNWLKPSWFNRRLISVLEKNWKAMELIRGRVGDLINFCKKMHEIMLLMENIFVCYVKLIVCRCTFVFWRNCYAGVTDSINSLSLQSRPIKMRIFYQNESCRISAILWYRRKLI